MEKVNFIDGENVGLCPINPDHFPLYLKWQNDPKVRKFARRTFPVTIDQMKKELEEPRPAVPESVSFEIIYKPDNKPVGRCGLHHFSWPDRHASIGMGIGETEYWGKGIGTEAGQLLLRYGFIELNLHKILAHIFSPNIGSQTAAQKAGLTLEAQMKEMIFVDGKYYDDFVFGITQDEWRALHEQEL